MTTCNYVLVIETPRLCQEPAFLVGQEEKKLKIRCRPIVADSWQHGQPPQPPIVAAKPGDGPVRPRENEGAAAAARRLGIDPTGKTHAEVEFERAQREAVLQRAREAGEQMYGRPGTQQQQQQQQQARDPQAQPHGGAFDAGEKAAADDIMLTAYDEKGKVVLDPIELSDEVLKALDIDVEELLQEAQAQGFQEGETAEFALEIDADSLDAIRVKQAEKRLREASEQNAGRGQQEQSDSAAGGQKSMLDRLDGGLRKKLTDSIENDLKALLDDQKRDEKTKGDDGNTKQPAGETETPEQKALRERMKAMSDLLMQALGADAQGRLREDGRAAGGEQAKAQSNDANAKPQDAKPKNYMQSIMQAREDAEKGRKKASDEFQKRVAQR